MSDDAAIEFMLKMAAYFEVRAVNTKEDSEYWACLQNSKNCAAVADRLRFYANLEPAQ